MPNSPPRDHKVCEGRDGAYAPSILHYEKFQTKLEEFYSEHPYTLDPESTCF